MTEINKFSLPSRDFILLAAKERLKNGQDLKLEAFVALTLARCKERKTDNAAKHIFKNKFISDLEKLERLFNLSDIELHKLTCKTH